MSHNALSRAPRQNPHETFHIKHSSTQSQDTTLFHHQIQHTRHTHGNPSPVHIDSPVTEFIHQRFTVKSQHSTTSPPIRTTHKSRHHSTMRQPLKDQHSVSLFITRLLQLPHQHSSFSTSSALHYPWSTFSPTVHMNQSVTQTHTKSFIITRTRTRKHTQVSLFFSVASSHSPISRTHSINLFVSKCIPGI